MFGFSERTFLQHGNAHYLTAEFLAAVAQAQPGTVLVKLAERDGTAVATAIFFQGGGTLYGRYWGSAAPEDCLHFEACYYQGIEHCIAAGLESFDPGTQGEHKLARGFEPTLTQSAHWLAHDGIPCRGRLATSSVSGPPWRSTLRPRRSTCPSSAGRRRDSVAASG